MKSIIDNILIQNKMQFIEINTKHHQFDRLILQTHIRFYCQSNSYIKHESVERIKGKCYKKLFDFNKNPKFLIQEGIFRINIKKEEYLLDGEGIEYCGKSEIIKIQGVFIQGELQEIESKQKSKSFNLQENSQSRAKIIIIMDQNNQIIRSKSLENDNEKLREMYQGNRILYNQSLSDRDVNILRNNSKEWLTSSLIDSFVEYLNQKSEIKVNMLQLEERMKIPRILFIPSYVTSSFGLYEDETTYMKKAEGLLQTELLFYKELNYEMKQIYTKIGFPVNINNMHWVFLLFDLRKEEILLFDSLKSTKKKRATPGYLSKAIGRFLNLDIRKCYLMNYIQQKDNYSCGYFVSSFMEFEYKLQFNKNCRYFYDENKMKMKFRQLMRFE
ncbi:unnamed protein product [Paramecium pentaurelia]|uniref:Ubiquitin-like protease family profile domain-containing protein n=1 Tax=Paramecium pentaurelia TaxID=43138 RepID=A0A8S1YBD1_9CILI|nr:unnamed protein product [Paramecium pentaurelia]